MRQFLTLRYWLTLLALVVLVVLVAKCTSDSGGGSAAPDPGVVGQGVVPHHVDLLVPVLQVQAPGGVVLTDGVVQSELSMQIDATRTMSVKVGTPGLWNCPLWEQERQCIVAADLLGDAVLWFEVVPGPPNVTLKVPAVVELLSDNMVQLANGWILPRASVVERSCSDDTTSLKNFVDTFGDTATATFDVELQKVVKVTCPRGGATTSSVPDTSGTQGSTTIGPSTTVPSGPTTTVEPG